MARSKFDEVNRPAHYNTGKIEVLDFIEDQDLDYRKGNVIKYVCRAGRKEGVLEVTDLKKAAFYLNRTIKRLEKVQPKRARK